ncbi:sugar ABC transporter ATP-binding protein [Paenibacillus sp. PK3_47]|uniref:carbohydrate ABC transporter permease n=1 Tax=Paenibacillus sp. PK3_47 TaxID=2072642 RepID=UPI00201E00C0|nr:carbohydrate ABC transporter permease [Paenibacillus sp. PK3_47]UQZ36877.1 sugar ABC transporter ATP-binding protein [Paenibacillus sp. PK3_47]
MSATAAVKYSSIKRAKSRSRMIHLALIALSCLLAVIFAFPLYWLLRGAFVSHSEILARPPVFFPEQLSADNFKLGLERIQFLRQLWNSVSIVVPYVIGTVLTTSFAGYAFAKLRFPLRGMWFVLVISSMMLPSAVTLLPQFSLYTSLGLAGKPALIIPAFFCAGGNAYFVFLLRQFFMTIPGELSEAAKIDGAGHFRIYASIMLPLIRPAMIVVALFSFINCWNEFFYTMIYLKTEADYTLPMGLYIVNGMRIPNYEQVMALALVVTAPCLVFFLIGNKYFVEGITLTGIKG